jgi:hypothetical protein
MTDIPPNAASGKSLSPAARRALEEAEARRRAQAAAEPPPEQGGPKGPEPTRYGDWERKGIASDF